MLTAAIYQPAGAPGYARFVAPEYENRTHVNAFARMGAWPATGEALRADYPLTHAHLARWLEAPPPGGICDAKAVFELDRQFPVPRPGVTVQFTVAWLGADRRDRYALMQATAPLADARRVRDVVASRGAPAEAPMPAPPAFRRAIPRLSAARSAAWLREESRELAASGGAPGVSLEWACPLRAPGAPEDVVAGAVGRLAEVVFDECCGYVESAAAAVLRDAPALCWAEAEKVPALDPPGRAAGFARLAAQIAAFRDSYGEPLPLEPACERLLAEMGGASPRPGAAGPMWAEVRRWGVSSADDGARAFAAALGQSVAALLPDPFWAGLQRPAPAARAFAVQQVLLGAFRTFARGEAVDDAVEIVRVAMGLA